MFEHHDARKHVVYQFDDVAAFHALVFLMPEVFPGM